MPSYVEAVVEAVTPLLDRPYALFGHSLGALAAFETARQLQARGVDTRGHLFVAAHNAPHVPRPHEAISDLPDATFLKRVEAYNGIPEDVLQHEELLDLMLPALRADFQLYEAYACKPGDPLACPVTAWAGLQDPTTDEEGVKAWAEHTTGVFEMALLPGDHFFVNTSRRALLWALSKALGAMTA